MKSIFLLVACVLPLSSFALTLKHVPKNILPKKAERPFQGTCQNFSGDWKGTCTSVLPNGEEEKTTEQMMIKQSGCYGIELVDNEGGKQNIYLGTLKQEKEISLKNGVYGGWSYPTVFETSFLADWNKEMTEIHFQTRLNGYPERITKDGAGTLEMNGVLAREGDTLKIIVTSPVKPANYSCTFSRQ